MIICLRGFWKDIIEQNTEKSFLRAFKNDFGIETDIRDSQGDIVISHDMPLGEEISVISLLELYILKKSKVPLILNIKSDGFKINYQK